MTASTSSRHRHQRDRTKHAVRAVKKAVAALVVLGILVGAGVVAISLSRGTWMVTPVLSGSMRPGFSVGGVVVSQRVPLADIDVRDVIVFENPIERTEQMIHRIIKLTRLPGGGIKIRTQGDANPVPDPWTVVIRTRFVYRIRWSLPLLGYVAVAYQNYRGVLVAVAGLLLVLVALGTWFTSGSRKKAEAGAGSPALEGAAPSVADHPVLPIFADIAPQERRSVRAHRFRP